MQRENPASVSYTHLKKGLEARLKKLQASDRKDDVIYFEQLGVDRMFGTGVKSAEGSLPLSVEGAPEFSTGAVLGVLSPLPPPPPQPARRPTTSAVSYTHLMKYTKFGRLVYAVGSNESAVQLAGINSKRVLFLVYLLEGILCALAGVLLTCRTGNASALTADGDYSLSTIAAVVIGGAALAGGEGTVLMTVVGAFIIAIIGNIMNLVGMASYPQMVVKGGIIILAVLMKGISSKKRL